MHRLNDLSAGAHYLCWNMNLGKGWDMAENTENWRVKRMPGDDTHAYMAVTPGCEGAPHPTRWCKCKPFRTMGLAEKYIAEITGEPVDKTL